MSAVAWFIISLLLFCIAHFRSSNAPLCLIKSHIRFTMHTLGMGIYHNFNIRVLLLSYEQVIDYLQIMYKYIIFS